MAVSAELEPRGVQTGQARRRGGVKRSKAIEPVDAMLGCHQFTLRLRHIGARFSTSFSACLGLTTLSPLARLSSGRERLRRM